jgi:hypothetical protein
MPVSADEFSNYPYYTPKYFDTILNMNPNLCRINAVEGKLLVEITLQNNYMLRFTVFNENGVNTPNVCFIQKEGDKYRAYFSFPAKARYIVKCFIQKQHTEQEYICCAEFGIISSVGNSKMYPTQYSGFSSDITIFEPIEMPLIRNKPCKFRVKSNKKYVAAIINGNFIQLVSDDNNIYSANIMIPSNIDVISLGVSDTNYGTYDTIAQYEIK